MTETTGGESGGEGFESGSSENNDFDNDFGGEYETQESNQEDPTELFKKHKHKVKIDDLESEIDYDELVKGYQREQAAQKRFQEAAAERKKITEERQQFKNELERKNQLESMLYAMKGNPELLFELATHLGHNPKALAAKLVQQEYELAQMTPEERELREYRNEKASREQQRQQAEQEAADNERLQYESYAKQQYAQVLDNEIGELIGAGEQITPRVFSRMLELMQGYCDTHGKPLSAKIAYQHIKKDLDLERGDLIKGLKPDQLPKEVREQLRKQELEKLKNLKKPQAKESSGGGYEGQPKKPTTEDYFKRLEGKYNSNRR